MSSKKLSRGSNAPVNHHHLDDSDDAEEDDEEIAEDFVPDDDDDEEDDSEFDENASASSSEGDEEGDREHIVLEGTLALDEKSNLHFQGDNFHLVSSEPVTWGVLDFSVWKSKSRAANETNFTIRMMGKLDVDLPWQLDQRAPSTIKSPPPSSLKPPPPSSLKPPPPSSDTKDAPKTQARLSSTSASMEMSHHRTFVMEISVTDYTTTKSDPSLKRVDQEHTHVPTNPDCMYHVQATETDPSASVPPLRFEGDYYPIGTADPCRLLCKVVKPRLGQKRNHAEQLPRFGEGYAHDRKPHVWPIQAGSRVRENGHSLSGLKGDPSPPDGDTAAGVVGAAIGAASSPAATAARYSPDEDSENEEDVDEDYDEDIDGDELLALQQEAAMSTAEVLRKRYRGVAAGGGGKAAGATDDEDCHEAKLSTTKRSRGNDDEDDYGF
jgi:hypothetical protein